MSFCSFFVQLSKSRPVSSEFASIKQTFCNRRAGSVTGLEWSTIGNGQILGSFPQLALSWINAEFCICGFFLPRSCIICFCFLFLRNPAQLHFSYKRSLQHNLAKFDITESADALRLILLIAFFMALKWRGCGAVADQRLVDFADNFF